MRKTLKNFINLGLVIGGTFLAKDCYERTFHGDALVVQTDVQLSPSRPVDHLTEYYFFRDKDKDGSMDNLMYVSSIFSNNGGHYRDSSFNLKGEEVGNIYRNLKPKSSFDGTIIGNN